MKKIFYLTMCIGLCFAATAQSVSDPTTRQKKVFLSEIGLVGGPNYHSIYRASPFDFDGKIGYRIGINTIWLLKKVSVSVGLVAERKGTSSTFQTTYFNDQSDPLIGTISNQLKLNYVVFPVSFNFPILGPRAIVAEMGCYVGYLRSAKSINEYSWQPPEAANAIQAFNRVDFGLNASLTANLITVSDTYRFGIGPFGSVGLIPANISQGYGGAPFRNYSFGILFSITQLKN